MVSDLLMPSKVTGFLTCLLRHKNQSRKEMHVAVLSALPHLSFPRVSRSPLWFLGQSTVHFWKAGASLRGSAGSAPEKWGVEETPSEPAHGKSRTQGTPQPAHSSKGIYPPTYPASYFRLLPKGKTQSSTNTFYKNDDDEGKSLSWKKVITSLFHIQCLSAHKHTVFVPGHEIFASFPPGGRFGLLGYCLPGSLACSNIERSIASSACKSGEILYWLSDHW